jgi:hypothetical protein
MNRDGLFFLKKEPKTVALRGFNEEKWFILFQKGPKTIASEGFNGCDNVVLNREPNR